MRIFDSFTFRVMLAVNSSPLLGHHTGGHPQPETEEVTWDCVQIERSVRLATMQKDSDARNRDVRDRQRKEQDLPPSCVRNAVEQEIKDEIQAGMMSHFLSKQSTNGKGMNAPGPRRHSTWFYAGKPEISALLTNKPFQIKGLRTLSGAGRQDR
jgi:hypothetical protein